MKSLGRSTRKFSSDDILCDVVATRRNAVTTVVLFRRKEDEEQKDDDRGYAVPPNIVHHLPATVTFGSQSCEFSVLPRDCSLGLKQLVIGDSQQCNGSRSFPWIFAGKFRVLSHIPAGSSFEFSTCFLPGVVG
jgi:hypothetical protein